MPSEESVLSTLARRSWIVVLAILLSIGIALVLTAREEVRYSARSTWVVTPASEIEDPSDVLRSLDTLERRTIVATFARLPGTSPVRVELEERLGMDDGALRGYSLRGSVVPYTNLIRFEVEGPESELAAAAANGLAREIRSEARTLYPIYTLREVEPARASSSPTHPDRSRNVVVGALIGLFVGLALATLPILTATRREREEAASSSDAPTL